MNATGGGVEKLTPLEHFNQLLSFLKDPQAHPHPTIALNNLVRVKPVVLRALRLTEFRQEALEFMESGLFPQGRLKGNRRTPDVVIDNLEAFILEAAAAFHLAKHQLNGSLFTYYLDSEGQPQIIDHDLIRVHNKMMKVFEQFRKIVLNPPPPVIKGKNLIHPDKLQRIRDDLYSLLSEALNRVEEETSFDLINELIPIFLRHIPKAPDNLIASHIFEFVRERQDSSLRGVDLPSTDVLRKRLKNMREKLLHDSQIPPLP